MSTQKDLRHEIKFSLPARLESEVRSWIYCHSDAFYPIYPPRQINNIYFDTHCHQFWQDHLDGVYQRSKLRYRWYGKTWHAINGQVELKSKIGKLGSKQVEPVEAKIDFCRQTWKEIQKKLSNQSGSLIQMMKETYPVMINHYQREYFINAEKNIRLTVDTKLVSYNQIFGLTPNIKFRKPIDDLLIIEVKAGLGQEKHIAEIISEMPVYSNQFSKYLSGCEV